jgi:hypothetical protein
MNLSGRSTLPGDPGTPILYRLEGLPMKNLLLLVLVIGAGIFVYTHFLNAPPASADERALADLEHQFDAASQSAAQAGRSAGAAGLDSTADIEAARAKVGRLDAELQKMKPRLADDGARRRAERLEEKIRAFRSSMGDN